MKPSNSAHTPSDADRLKPGRPEYGTVEPEYDKEIARTKVKDKERDGAKADSDDDSNETSGGRRPGKRKGTRGGDMKS